MTLINVGYAGTAYDDPKYYFMEKEVHWYRNDGSKPTPRRKALNRADEFDNRGQNERAKKIRSIVISKDHGDDYDARRKSRNIKVDDNKVGKLPTAAKSDKRGAIDVKHNLKKLKEVAPPAWGHTKAEKEKTNPDKPKSKIGGTAAAFKKALDDGRFKGLPGSKTKKEKTADMFKLMWAMKKKGAKPHYKPGTDEKYKKYQTEAVKGQDTESRKEGAKERATEKKAEVDFRRRGPSGGKKRPLYSTTRHTKSDAEAYATQQKQSIKWHDKRTKGKFIPGTTTEETSMPNVKEKDRGAINKRFKGLFKKDVKGTVQGVNESTTMQDNNLFGNAYAYDKLKKKIGSKKKHDKPVTVETFDINPKAHKTAQKKAKIRNLAKDNKNPNEKAAAEKRLGPKLIGEKISYQDFLTRVKR